MNISPQVLTSPYPPDLIRSLVDMAFQRRTPFYITGGTVRDHLLQRPASDLDITVAGEALNWAADLSHKLGGTLVVLAEQEAVARVVWQGITVDFSEFREGAESIEADLLKRDFTVNALAMPFQPQNTPLNGSVCSVALIDPAGGINDLRLGMIRCTSPEVFASDPLRLLRAYRFAAVLNFVLDRKTTAHIKANVSLIHKVAAERLAYELDLIMASARAHEAVAAMHASGLLELLFPELLAGLGMAQPASHHLDVFQHGLETLLQMENIVQRPGAYFPGQTADITGYLAGGRRKIWLKWAALFHDLGKPVTFRIREEKGGRITFYNHERAGAGEFRKIASRYRWSNEDTRAVARFVEMHMWPFHLNNVRRKGLLTPKACLRLVKAAGAELTGLFLLTMADCLAGLGPDRPPAMEKAMAELYSEVRRVFLASIKPVLDSPRLLDGHDLQREFKIPPGPVFRKIFHGLEKARVGGEVRTREDAKAWVRAFLQRTGGYRFPKGTK